MCVLCWSTITNPDYSRVVQVRTIYTAAVTVDAMCFNCQ